MEYLMSAFDLWQRGQQIIYVCVNEALERKKPSAEILNELRNIQLKLRELLRRAVLHVDNLDPDTFYPWRGPSSPIHDSWDLESLCEAIAKSDAKTVLWEIYLKGDCKDYGKFYKDWEAEMSNFMRNIDVLGRQVGVTADDPPITMAALYELCVKKKNRVGVKVAGSDSTVRGWKKAKDFPPTMTWNAVRKWLNDKKDYDIGPPPTEC